MSILEVENGINMYEEYLKDLGFADDAALSTEDVPEMETNLNIINKQSKKVGLKIHKDRTKYMTNYEIDEKLHKYGYKHVDAVEPNPDFVKVLEEKNIYGRIYRDFFGGDKQIDIPCDTYDALTICGAMGPGHLPCSAVTEMIRVVKPGGYVVNCMREEYLWTVPEYKDRLEPLCEKYEKEGRWKKIKREIYPNHFCFFFVKWR